MVALKLIPQLLAWTGLVAVLLRAFPGRRGLTAVGSAAGFAAGAAGAFLLFGNFPAALPYAVIRGFLGGSFLVFWGVALASLYRSTGGAAAAGSAAHPGGRPVAAATVTLCFALAFGALSACRLPGVGEGALSLPALLLLALAGCALAAAAFFLERLLPDSITVSFPGLLASSVALSLFASSFMIRLDLFSPLSMKVMKGIHDFVHQFMESVLIPDHLFVRPAVWGYIGILFGKEVGFWGGMLIWFTPVCLLLLAIRLELLPRVSHIRQGAQRRRLLADAIRSRNLRMTVPALTLVLFSAAAYQSRNPTVEYWDPKPLPVAASAAGEIFIPRKGEVGLEDGKLHKFLYRQGGREARFFVIMTPSGKLSVDLDACAICKPDGYGQTEGTVICYYCKTLIPLETVGMPGGCNPVPVRFAEREDGVHIDGITLINAWSSTVQTAGSKKEGAK